jgi:hypothetical protein
MPALEMSRYCIPWTPFRRRLEECTVMLVSTAGIHHSADPPFDPEGDLSFRRVPGNAAAAELRYSDKHYDHACVDKDLNAVFPIDRLTELAREGRIAGLAEAHFSTGFIARLREFRDQTVPALVDEVAKLRPHAVLLTGG